MPLNLAAAVLKLPVHLYRWTLKPFFGAQCRHAPSCSSYALAAIDLNGAWRGFWLMISRLSRCGPFGTSGFDPAPDIRAERHVLAPWRYGDWNGRHMRELAREPQPECCDTQTSRPA